MGPAAYRDTTNISVDDARRIDTGGYVQAESALGGFARISGGIRGDGVTTKNIGGFFGDRSTSERRGIRVGRSRSALQGFSVTAQLSRGFATPCCPTATSGAIRSRLHHR